MNGNGKNKAPHLQVAPPAPAQEMIIRVYNDRPPAVTCTGDLEIALRLMATALMSLAGMLSQEARAKAPVEDRKREFLGPREERDEG